MSTTHPIRKRKSHRGTRGGKKKMKKASTGAQSDLEATPDTSASGPAAPPLTFLGEAITEEETAFLAVFLRQFRMSR
ncbi:hypothetical protein PITC_026610 [Penicillium italicum]|uniref:Uncharacterized protein n=1 Tax=Penicillium italicum TaxID=40296 RepID=A0A0A2KYG0_PENIT|nr:hypothetical protein PITC_026610 [Penicillium italicum]